MEIELHKIPVREVVADFVDDPVRGCTGYGGKLNIRPAFQREFVYNDAQRDAVIRTVQKGFPLNVMYWVRSGDGTFEMLDGQQRTISICKYAINDFSLERRSFDSLSDYEREQFLSYELMIYICAGNDAEKLSWFEVINTAGEKLTEQEARNAIYACEWLDDAKNYFSRPNCPAHKMYQRYLKGSATRQDFLETALKWIVDRDALKSPADYMDAQKRNHTPTAVELWSYFRSVFDWVESLFPSQPTNLMKGLPWGILYNAHKDKPYNPTHLAEQISELLLDDEVTNKRGIFAYVLSGDEKSLNLRRFSASMKSAAYERQGGICAACGNHFELSEMEGDHIDPWSAGGKTTQENCQMLCKSCNRRKSSK